MNDIRDKLTALSKALSDLGLESEYWDNTGGGVPVTYLAFGDHHLLFGTDSASVYKGDGKDGEQSDSLMDALYNDDEATDAHCPTCTCDKPTPKAGRILECVICKAIIPSGVFCGSACEDGPAGQDIKARG